ncbi:hypothetical protein ABMA79_02015 [Halobacteriovorax sp. HFRX-2_2]|uniref:hypothetical protein n=1 Tax=unclassified Halobacteriovorax TaxID=2639665 RepID=UPI00371030B5
MRSIYLSLLIALTAFSAHSAMAQTTKQKFCKERENKHFVRNQMMTKISAHMGFRNYGGLLNGGVCWWHSRFHRNALYLGVFRPEYSKPSEDEAKNIIKAIRRGRSVVEIPGYRNLREFSIDNDHLIQNELEAWQKTDGFINQQWVIGLLGTPKRSANGMRKMMDGLYDRVVNQGDVTYQKLQIKGIDAHAWLVVDMKKTRTGYTLYAVDSNFPGELQKVRYNYGDKFFHYNRWYGEFAPYTGRKVEIKRVKKVIKEFCE